MQRPTGISILAILALCGAIFGVIGGTVAMAGGFALTGSLLLLIAALDVILGWGFWTLKPWAWTLGMALQMLQIIQVVLGWFTAFSWTSIVPLIVAGAILWYLFQPEIKQVFGKAPARA